MALQFFDRRVSIEDEIAIVRVGSSVLFDEAYSLIEWNHGIILVEACSEKSGY